MQNRSPVFKGKFKLDKPLTPQLWTYFWRFSATRHMKRSANMLANVSDPLRKAVGLPIGPEGAYFVGAREDHDSPNVINSNEPPIEQPGLYCQWVPNEAGTAIEWNGGDKFYFFVEWLEYLIKHFLQPWGYKVNGKMRWKDDEAVEWSESAKDFRPCVEQGEIVVVDNNIEVKRSMKWLV